MENSKTVSMPLEVGKYFEFLKDETPVEVQRYQMAIGCLMQAVTNRSDNSTVRNLRGLILILVE